MSIVGHQLALSNGHMQKWVLLTFLLWTHISSLHKHTQHNHFFSVRHKTCRSLLIPPSSSTLASALIWFLSPVLSSPWHSYCALLSDILQSYTTLCLHKLCLDFCGLTVVGKWTHQIPVTLFLLNSSGWTWQYFRIKLYPYPLSSAHANVRKSKSSLSQ